jgi:hypothetical protein
MQPEIKSFTPTIEEFERLLVQALPSWAREHIERLMALKLALQPLKQVHECIVRQRQGWANEAFIIFESDLDERVRFTFGQLDAIVRAMSEPQSEESA